MSETYVLTQDVKFKGVENARSNGARIVYKVFPKGTVVRWRGLDDEGNVMVQKDDMWQWVSKKVIKEASTSPFPLPPMPSPMITTMPKITIPPLPQWKPEPV